MIDRFARIEGFDIVDAQLHIGPGSFEPYLEAMNSLGINSVLIDEFWVTSVTQSPTQVDPGYRLPNGAWRAIYPVAQLAATLHPDRFSYFVRLDRADPDLESVARLVASSPSGRGFRITPRLTAEETSAFMSGAFEPMMEILQEIGLPLCLFVPGLAEYLPFYLRKFPRLQFVIDHCGMGMPGLPPSFSASEGERATSPTYFAEVLKLAEFPNVALKISHAPLLFWSDTPYEAARKHLRSAIEAFGADRLLWATDKTLLPSHTWADLLLWVRDDPELSHEEKSRILGKSARSIFRWPAAKAGQ
jgi:predicted TIM-barrel fold metal-dependent hydrolase